MLSILILNTTCLIDVIPKLKLMAKTTYSFQKLIKLIFISIGVVGDDKINCYKAQEVSQKIMNDIIGANLKMVILKRINRVMNLGSANRTKICIREDILRVKEMF